MLQLNISQIDFVILIAYLLAMVVFGLWMGGRQRDIADYLVGGRSLPWWAVLFSIVATETSTATFLSIPGVAYAEGGNLTFLQLAAGYIVGRHLVVRLLLPHYFRGELFTSYEVLHRRFGGAVKQAASALFIITRSLADGLRLFLAATVLELMVGAPLPWAVIAMGAATIIYTFFGGMKAVVWNDCLQFAVYIAGALIAGAVLLAELPGGWSQVTNFAATHGKFQVFDFELGLSTPYTFWAGLIGGAFFSLGSHGTDQLMVQRYLSARNEREAGRALALSGWVVLAQFALFLLLGVGLACFYDAFPPDSPIARNDQAFARFIVDFLPVGVVGVTLAAVFSAAMSTLSSSLNSSATALLNDFYRPLIAPAASPRRLLTTSRVFTVVFGVVQIGVALAGPYLAESVVESVLAIGSFTTGIVLGVFFLGIFVRRVNQPAALVAVIGGLAGMSGVAFATAVAWPWYVVIGSLGTLVIGWLASYVFVSDQGGA